LIKYNVIGKVSGWVTYWGGRDRETMLYFWLDFASPPQHHFLIWLISAYSQLSWVPWIFICKISIYLHIHSSMLPPLKSYKSKKNYKMKTLEMLLFIVNCFIAHCSWVRGLKRFSPKVSSNFWKHYNALTILLMITPNLTITCYQEWNLSYK